MAFSLGSAGLATGMAKSSILRAIRAGRLSATRTDDGSWSIDPAELARVFPLIAIPGAPPPQPQTEHDATTDVLVAELRNMLADVRRDRDEWRLAHERGQAALAEALAAHAATQRLLPAPDAMPVEQDAPTIEQDAPMPEQDAMPVDPPIAPPKRRWWRRASAIW